MPGTIHDLHARDAHRDYPRPRCPERREAKPTPRTFHLYVEPIGTAIVLAARARQ